MKLFQVLDVLKFRIKGTPAEKVDMRGVEVCGKNVSDCNVVHVVVEAAVLMDRDDIGDQEIKLALSNRPEVLIGRIG